MVLDSNASTAKSCTIIIREPNVFVRKYLLSPSAARYSPSMREARKLARKGIAHQLDIIADGRLSATFGCVVGHTFEFFAAGHHSKQFLSIGLALEESSVAAPSIEYRECVADRPNVMDVVRYEDDPNSICLCLNDIF
jgi:hypothetical protein